MVPSRTCAGASTWCGARDNSSYTFPADITSANIRCDAPVGGNYSCYLSTPLWTGFCTGGVCSVCEETGTVLSSEGWPVQCRTGRGPSRSCIGGGYVDARTATIVPAVLSRNIGAVFNVVVFVVLVVFGISMCVGCASIRSSLAQKSGRLM
jgi:hypothetical protein